MVRWTGYVGVLDRSGAKGGKEVRAGDREWFKEVWYRWMGGSDDEVDAQKCGRVEAK